MKTKNLSCAALDVQAKHYDFLDMWEAETVRVVVESDELSDLPDVHVNYFYALPHFRMDEQEAAKKISRLPLVIVYFPHEPEGEDYGLMLTGCGMDLSWEIADAFIQLGYLPPLFLADLPRMADPLDSQKRRVLTAMATAIRFKQAQLKHDARRIRDIRKWYTERAKKD